LPVLATSGPSEHEHKMDIEHFQEVLQTRVRKDILTLHKKFNDLVDEVNTALEGLQFYTEKSITELRKHTLANMVERDTSLDNNTRTFEEFARSRIEDLDNTMRENFENLNKISKDERSSTIEWIHQRSHQHEDLLKTEIGLCVYDHGHRGIGVVTYNSAKGPAGYIDDHTKWTVFNATNPDNCCLPLTGGKCEDCAMKVLNRQTGKFTVPPSAAGLYLFTFSATMDTFDFNHGLSPNEYKFEKNGEVLEETGLYADAGSNWKNDKVPGSRTIFLRLEDGDSVAVRQTRAKYVLDHHISFCGALIHLKKASETPGMSLSQSGSFDPPTISKPELSSVGYDFSGFQAIPPLSSFEYATKDEAEEDLMVSSETLIGELFADKCENYRSNTRNQNKLEPCATLDGFRNF